jgi:hypothetical protein
MRALLEPLAFSSLWVAASAAALCAASARALGAEPALATAALAAAGTIVVYNVDRLRDVERDRATSPRRTAFVQRWRFGLVVLTAAAGLAAGALALSAGPRALALLAPIAALGLLHRRLKRFAWWKPLYVSGAWTAVVVGLPALALPPRVRSRGRGDRDRRDRRQRDRLQPARRRGGRRALRASRAVAHRTRLRARGERARLRAPAGRRARSRRSRSRRCSRSRRSGPASSTASSRSTARCWSARCCRCGSPSRQSVPGRPRHAAQQPALPAVAQRERVVHPGARLLVALGHLDREQRRERARLGDLLPQHDLAALPRAVRGAEAAQDREQRAAALGVARISAR